MSKNTSISLGNYFDQFVHNQVSAGRYKNVSEVIRAGLRLLEDEESKVIALGTGKTDDNGKKVPFEVKKGDKVLVSKYGGTEIKLDGKEYKILNSDDILAIIN